MCITLMICEVSIQMKSQIKQYCFSLSENKVITLQIKEIESNHYSNKIWPSAPVLAQFIATNHVYFQNKTLIELGSGTGLCGIVAAMIGSNVILTDRAESLDLCRYNSLLNHVPVQVEPFEWGVYRHCPCPPPGPDCIISSDCFYDEADFEDILFSVALLQEFHPEKNIFFLVSYQNRCSTYSIECLTRRWNFRCEKIILDEETSKYLHKNTEIEIYLIYKQTNNVVYPSCWNALVSHV